MVERKGDVPSLSFSEAAAGPVLYQWSDLAKRAPSRIRVGDLIAAHWGHGDHTFVGHRVTSWSRRHGAPVEEYRIEYRRWDGTLGYMLQPETFLLAVVVNPRAK